MSALGLLEGRRDPVGRTKARELLGSKDDYIWFNAALYLGALGDEEAVPYLIKGLKHPASRAYDKVVAQLESLTGQKFGKDQAKWLAWWKERNPQAQFDFTYPAFEEKATALDTESYLLINAVDDPVTIRSVGVRIVLIGVKLKAGGDAGKAVALLKQLVINQYVRFQFDQGPVLDEEGRRKALVYWEEGGPEPLAILRRGLPPVPFKERALVNAYLLKSGLYEMDLEGVHDEGMKHLLEPGAQGSH